MENEHTLYTVSQTENGITGSEGFSTADEMLAHVRDLLAANPCAKIALDKYTPSEDEVRDYRDAMADRADAASH